MKSQLEELAAALDRAISPDERKSINFQIERQCNIDAAQRRAAKLKSDQATALALQRTPPPSHAAYVLIEARPELAEFRAIFNAMLPALTAAKASWTEAYETALAHNFQGSRKEFERHRAEIETAGGDMAATQAIKVRSREDIDAEFRIKASAAHQRCGKLAAQMRLITDPVIQLFADEVENLANKIEGTQGIAVAALGLDGSPSPAVMQLRSGVNLMRTSPHNLSPAAPVPTSIADFVSKP